MREKEPVRTVLQSADAYGCLQCIQGDFMEVFTRYGMEVTSELHALVCHMRTSDLMIQKQRRCRNIEIGACRYNVNVLRSFESSSFMYSVINDSFMITSLFIDVNSQYKRVTC